MKAVGSASLPSHLRRPNAEVFRDVQEQFREDAAFVLSLRLEKQGEAVEGSSPGEFDCDVRREIRHSKLVPFRRTDDKEELQDWFEYAQSAVPGLEHLFEAGAINVELLRSWGV